MVNPLEPKLKKLPRILVVTGPTASGKSDLAIEISQRFNGEIVNGDSVQLYKGFDIGSSKPTVDQQKIVPHHLFSIIEPSSEFDVHKFIDLGRAKILEIVDSGKLPVVVGGTGLYVRALLCGLIEHAEVPQTVVEIIHAKESEFTKLGSQVSVEMHRWLAEVDPESASKIHFNDLFRIRRALSVMISGGRSVQELRREHGHSSRWCDALVLCCLPGRVELYENINRRVELMLEQGLIAEVAQLSTEFPNSRALSAIGYAQVVSYLMGQIDLAEMERLIKRDTRRFAKRQYTWWNQQPERLGWNVSSIGFHSDELTRGQSRWFNREVELVLEQYLADSPAVQFSAINFLRLQPPGDVT